MFGFLNFGQPVTSPYLTVAGNQSMAVEENYVDDNCDSDDEEDTGLDYVSYDDFGDDDDNDDNDDWAGFVQAGLIGHRCASLLPY